MLEGQSAIAQAVPEGATTSGWESVPFDEAISKERFAVGKVRLRDYKPSGLFPVIDQGQGKIAGYWDDERDVYRGPLPVIVFGDHTRAVKLVDSPFVCGADGTKILLPNRERFEPEFLFYALLGVKLPSRGYNRHFRLLREAMLPCPPVNEQRAIAAVLRAVYEANVATEKVIATTRELKRAIMSHLFTRGPVSTEVANRVEVKETDLGMIPAHWKVQRLDQSGIIQSGVTKGRKLSGAVIEVPYLRVANVQDGFLDLREVKTIRIKEGELERFRLRPGDVLFTEGGDIDKLGRGHIWLGEVDRCVHQNHIFAVRPEPELLSPEYLSYLVQSSYGKAYFLRVGHRTTHLASINRAKLGALPVPIPPRPEQDDMVRALLAVDAKIEAEIRYRDILTNIFAALLSDLMTGRRRAAYSEVA